MIIVNLNRKYLCDNHELVNYNIKHCFRFDFRIPMCTRLEHSKSHQIFERGQTVLDTPIPVKSSIRNKLAHHNSE